MLNSLVKFTLAGIAAVSVAVLGSAVPVKAANLIQNGSFELGVDPGPFLPLNPGSTAIDNWVVTRAQIDYYTGWEAADGVRSLDLNGTPGVGGIAQTFNTTVGLQYLVNFALAGHNSGLLQTIGVTAAGQSTQFSFQSVPFVPDDPLPKLGWVTKSWEFTAVDTQTTLEFFSLQSDYPFGGPALDDVSVVPVSVVAVPEYSSTLALLTVGILGSGLALKRKLPKPRSV